MRIFLSLILLLLATPSWAGWTTRAIYTPICGLPQSTEDQDGWSDSSRGRMWCFAFVPCIGISGAKSLAIRMGTTTISNSSNTIGLAYYTNTGNYIVKGTATYDDTKEESNIVFSSLTYNSLYTDGISFSLSPGILYYQCHCSAETSGAGSYFRTRTVPTALDEFFNALTTERWGATDISHYCDTTTAMPPDSMGTLSAGSSAAPVIVKVGGNSP